MERARGGADLFIVWGDVSQHSRTEAGAAWRIFGVDPVDSARVLAHTLPPGVVGYDPDGVGEEQSRSVLCGVADQAGVEIRSVGNFVCERVRPDATAALGGQGNGARGRHDAF